MDNFGEITMGKFYCEICDKRFEDLTEIQDAHFQRTCNYFTKQLQKEFDTALELLIEIVGDMYVHYCYCTVKKCGYCKAEDFIRKHSP